MRTWIILSICGGSLLLATALDATAQGRGRQPQPNRGGGGSSRAAPQQHYRPPVQRPAQRPSRPPSFTRPNTPSVQRPSTGNVYRPGVTQRPQRPSTPPVVQRPATPQRPTIPPTVQRPAIPQRPTTPPTVQRPSTRPGGVTNLPGWGNSNRRPPSGNRPDVANRPNINDRDRIINNRDRDRIIDNRNRNRDTIINQNRNTVVNRTQINQRITNHRNQFFNNFTANRPVVNRHINDWSNRWDHGFNRWHPWYNRWHGHWHDHNHWWYWRGHHAFLPPLWNWWLWGGASLYYYSGYYPYYNPYYVPVTYVQEVPALDYSQPLVVTAASEPTPTAAQSFDAAREAFRNNDYGQALRLVNQALRDTPGDPALHEFRALVLFAQGQYQEAAAGLYAVLSAGPGWDWATMIGLYPDVGTYERQLRALEQYRTANPNAAGARLYLAYLYKTSDHDQAAVNELMRVTALQPRDQVAANLLRVVQADLQQDAQGAEQVPQPDQPPAEPAGPTMELGSLIGTWQARRAQDNAPINLLLNRDGSFRWTFAQQGKTNTIEGNFTYEGGVLMLEQRNGGVIVGRVTAKGNGFNFRMPEAPQTDPGLDFQR